MPTPIPHPSIPPDRIREMLGRPIHLAWARPGDVWILVAVDGERIRLQTPRTKRERWDWVKNAQYTRYWAGRLGVEE